MREAEDETSCAGPVCDHIENVSKERACVCDERSSERKKKKEKHNGEGTSLH